MGRIRILPEPVANKIAAGEVVERPASVVKELIENSLDAGAGRIRAEIEAGGKQRIHIVDDGCGMGRDDALLAFERHATSKLRSADDLLSIATMGFRGEALPSIAAVSRLTLETRSLEEPSGTRIEFAGGRLLNVQESGLPGGTAITVNGLFYNVPARRKFLRAEATELAHITTLVTHYALAFPEKSFHLETQTGELIRVSPAGTLRDRVFQLFGGEMLEDLVEFEPRTAEVPAPPPETGWEEGGEAACSLISLSGFLSRPQVQKLNRNSLYLFVNRRHIRDRVLLHAIQEAYRNVLPPRCFPVAMLFLEMPHTEVDVNVHPAKTEVRFRHQAFVHDFVREALREALAVSKPVSTFPAGATMAPNAAPAASLDVPLDDSRETPAAGHPRGGAPSAATGGFRLAERPLPPMATPLGFDAALGITAEDIARAATPAAGSLLSPTESPGESEPDAAAELAQLQPLGQIRDSFIVAASPSGLWLIDQHVAHERVLFEQFLAKREQGSVETQRLLLPYILHLSPAQQALWAQIAEELAASGFEAEPFGQGTVAVKAVPAGIQSEEIEKLLAEIVESLEKESRAISPERVLEKIAASVACHAAIKINTPLERNKMEWLLAKLAATRLPMSCPHGRPVVLKYGMREILKAFHRM